MLTIDNQKEKVDIAPENPDNALDLICKRGYTCDAAAKALKTNASELKIMIRKELSKYRQK